MTVQKSPVFGIVAGEISGDTLGAGLIRALRSRYPNARFIGIAGPQMIAEGAETIVPMERLSVMGLVEVLGRLKELFGVRDQLVARLREEKIDAFIGIDAPDFNLRVAKQLHAEGFKTVHYVSPSVWAWRQGRVKGIAESIDTMLCLLPFEKQFYDDHAVKAVFVGHPLADTLPLMTDKGAARKSLGLPLHAKYVALLPGSRGGEVKYLAPTLFKAAQLLQKDDPELVFIIPAINAERKVAIEASLKELNLTAQVFDDARGPGVGREVMAASDVVLLASGTATLEAMLLKKPMVIAYRVHWLTYLIARLMVKSKWVGLPNLLANKNLVPEFLQDAATPETIALEARKWLDDVNYRTSKVLEFYSMHSLLKQDASEKAAEAVVELVEGTANAKREPS